LALIGRLRVLQGVSRRDLSVTLFGLTMGLTGCASLDDVRDATLRRG